MSIHTQHTDTETELTQQDHTLSDLLETYRHVQSDPAIPDARKRRAAERMTGVWARLAKLQDPDGFINHLSEYVQEQFQRRHHAGEDPTLSRRGKPLCRCSRPRHLCEAKEGLIPSKIQTQELTYLSKPSSRTLAREYVQSHAGDVVIREAMEDFRELRASIYADLSDIIAMMMGEVPEDEPEDATEPEDTPVGADDRPDSDPDGGGGGQGAADGPQDATDAPDMSSQSTAPPTQPVDADAPTASADGGEDVDPSEVVDGALASAVERHGAEQVAQDATDGIMALAGALDGYQDGDVSTEDLKAVADGERSIHELDTEPDVETDGDGGDADE